MKPSSTYVQYGCGLTAPNNWINYDASPTLRLQRIPLFNIITKRTIPPRFPDNVRYGNITIGLPGIAPNSCDAVFCSHVLEHLSYHDFKKALTHTYKILKPNGVFRLVMPDFEYLINSYLNRKKENDPKACIKLMEHTGMATSESYSKITDRMRCLISNSKHLWLWDKEATIFELSNIGFTNIEEYHYSNKPNIFLEVENPERFDGSMAIQCNKQKHIN